MSKLLDWSSLNATYSTWYVFSFPNNPDEIHHAYVYRKNTDYIFVIYSISDKDKDVIRGKADTLEEARRIVEKHFESHGFRFTTKRLENLL